MAILNFDATQVAPDAGQLDALPAGWYNTMMDQSEMKPTKDGSGSYLEARFNVLDGQFAGRKIFARLNLRNANPTAQEIAYKQLSAIAHAVGVLHVQDSQQLHNIPLKVKVKVRAANAEYEASNEIAAFKNINEQVGGAPAAAGAPAFTPPAQPAFAPPQHAAPPAQQAWAPPAAPAPAAAPAWQPPAQGGQPWAQPWAQPPAQAPQQQQPPAWAPPAQPAPQQAPAQPQAPAAGAPPAWAGAQGANPPWAPPQ